MESARQELQGRREYMSNDKIKSWGSRSNGIEAAAHSLIIHGFTYLHLFLLGIEYYVPAYSTTKAAPHTAWDHDGTKTEDYECEPPDQCESGTF